jgi:hypothetical protein
MRPSLFCASGPLNGIDTWTGSGWGLFPGSPRGLFAIVESTTRNRCDFSLNFAVPAAYPGPNLKFAAERSMKVCPRNYVAVRTRMAQKCGEEDSS